DHMMPKMDGIETLKTARKANILPAETKVVALTANAVNNAREEYLKVGFDGYLSKPIEVGELGEILKAFLPGDVLKWREDDVADAPEEPEESGSDVLEFEPDAQGVAVSENVSEELGNGVLEFVPDAQGVGGSEWDFRTQEDHVVSFDRDGGLEMDVIDRLEKQGFDVDSALSFCGQDEEFYVEMLGDYVDAYARKNQQLNEYFDAENWKDFEIVVHSVKSTSKTMGAMALADQALALEQAAKSQDAAFIRDAYPKFAEEYSQVVEEIRRVVL
ncbi:MAG: response regulator, partial [Lachnospiraceae bacterium]|nr:response regulator [Lachnospiraceae bacterium]